MRIVGISAFYHDSAVALVEDGEVVAAAQEERYSRVKHDARFPALALRALLDHCQWRLADVDEVVYFEKPFLKFERLLETQVAAAPSGFAQFAQAMPVWLREKLLQKKVIADALAAVEPGYRPRAPLKFSEHHLSHAASAYYPSPFDRALVLTMDGVGEWATTTAALGHGNQLQMLCEQPFPHSLGLLYSAFTYHCGFKVNSGEYKLMGLAPYGKPRYADRIARHLLDRKADGSFRLRTECFGFLGGLTMTNKRFNALFDGPPRTPEAPITEREMDLAASIQQVLEEQVLALCTGLKQRTGERQLCLAGGVALNCVANGVLARSGLYDAIYIQPAAGDAGGALGAALALAHLGKGLPRPALGLRNDRMGGALLGPDYTAAEACAALDAAGAVYETLDDETLIARVAADLATDLAVGWCQGRMEFGPRALGARSILGDPRSASAQSKLNLKVKFRESFRPFAPAVLAEHAGDWFELEHPSPYMLLVAPIRPTHRRVPDADGRLGLAAVNQVRSTVPAITHVDYSARVQTVDNESQPLFRRLIEAFHALTGCPMLINTSFNVRGEPIVATPADALRCFMGTELDRLAVGPCYLKREDQPQALHKRYAHLLPAD